MEGKARLKKGGLDNPWRSPPPPPPPHCFLYEDLVKVEFPQWKNFLEEVFPRNVALTKSSLGGRVSLREYFSVEVKYP